MRRFSAFSFPGAGPARASIAVKMLKRHATRTIFPWVWSVFESPGKLSGSARRVPLEIYSTGLITYTAGARINVSAVKSVSSESRDTHSMVVATFF